LQNSLNLRGKISILLPPNNQIRLMELLIEKLSSVQQKIRSLDFAEFLPSVTKIYKDFLKEIKNIGITEKMSYYEKRKLGIFNQLNFFQLLTGILFPVLGLLHKDDVPFSAWLLASLPSTISVCTLLFNYQKKHQAALLSYFLLYPFFTGFVYLQGMNAGIELNFILYGVLAVFFLQDIGYMLFAVALSMINYFVLAIMLSYFRYDVNHEYKALFFLNHIISLSFIIYGLYLIKKENTSYQFLLQKKRKALQQKNAEVNEQKKIIAEKVILLEAQTAELAELDNLKSKLFSVVSHDLRSPMYALRNLFRNMHQKNTPAQEIKNIVPDVLMDLNYTIGLMENLLQWSKTQMQSTAARPEELEVSKIINEVLQLLHLQAEAKQIYIENKNNAPVFVHADKDMVNLVLRNLLSNAIKFTPNQGYIEVGVNEVSSFVEIYVQDTGVGISKESIQKINESNFYTTKGTASESGTGLGLMLCKEFLHKNGGQMHIESEPGKGSVFSFTLPRIEVEDVEVEDDL
jgi:two-component system sensor histidine kinase/response regulator